MNAEIVPFIDIHTHQHYHDEDVLSLRSLFLTETLKGKQKHTVGVHPWEIVKTPNEWETILRKKLSHGDCLGLGECGIDRAIQTPIDLQLSFLEKQLKLYREFPQKLVVVHCVRAYSDLIPFFKQYPELNYLLHDYNGGVEQTLELMKFSCYFSYGQKLDQLQSKAMKSLSHIPLDRLFLETDDSKIHIIEQYQKLADLKEIEIGVVRNQLYKNYRVLFNEAVGESR